MKSTIKIEDMVAEVNRLNRESTCEPAIREGWNSLANHFLMATDRYDGFRYLTQNEVPALHLAGIIPMPDARNLYPDSTRIEYFWKRTAKEKRARYSNPMPEEAGR